MNYNMTKPCDNCPFRSDKHFPLGRGRVLGIIRSGDFPCHKTTLKDDLDGDEEGLDSNNETACAGLLILLEKENQPNQMMRIAERLGFYDRTKLDMNAPVYDSIRDAVIAIELNK